MPWTEPFVPGLITLKITIAKLFDRYKSCRRVGSGNFALYLCPRAVSAKSAGIQWPHLRARAPDRKLPGRCQAGWN